MRCKGSETHARSSMAAAHGGSTFGHVFLLCQCCLQANSGHEVPVQQPFSHAVVQQQDLSTQQPSAALFREGVASRHTQVPSSSSKLHPEVSKTNTMH